MIGIDLIKTSRMDSFIEKFKDKALKKFLCSSEIELVKNYKTAAGFWAAKEACSKALGVGIGSECSFHDIHIAKTSKGAPFITLSQHILKNYNISDISLSITHDGDYAVAVVAIEKSATTNKV
jgi:holo-[acyl-carrier protein] synthase